MSDWTNELKEQVKKEYLEADPTAENSTEIVKEISERVNQSPNGVRMVLVQAGVYVRKDTASSTTTKTKDADATKRVSKESQIDALKKAIEVKGGDLDEDILSKLTGKAAAYFTSILTK